LLSIFSDFPATDHSPARSSIHTTLDNCYTHLQKLQQTLNTQSEINQGVADELEKQPQCLELSLERRVLSLLQKELSLRCGRFIAADVRSKSQPYSKKSEHRSTTTIPSIPPFSVFFSKIKKDASAALVQLQHKAQQQRQHTILPPTHLPPLPPPAAARKTQHHKKNRICINRKSLPQGIQNQQKQLPTEEGGNVALRGDAAPSTSNDDNGKEEEDDHRRMHSSQAISPLPSKNTVVEKVKRKNRISPTPPGDDDNRVEDRQPRHQPIIEEKEEEHNFDFEFSRPTSPGVAVAVAVVDTGKVEDTDIHQKKQQVMHHQHHELIEEGEYIGLPPTQPEIEGGDNKKTKVAGEMQHQQQQDEEGVKGMEVVEEEGGPENVDKNAREVTIAAAAAMAVDTTPAIVGGGWSLFNNNNNNISQRDSNSPNNNKKKNKPKGSSGKIHNSIVPEEQQGEEQHHVDAPHPDDEDTLSPPTLINEECEVRESQQQQQQKRGPTALGVVGGPVLKKTRFAVEAQAAAAVVVVVNQEEGNTNKNNDDPHFVCCTQLPPPSTTKTSTYNNKTNNNNKNNNKKSSSDDDNGNEKPQNTAPDHMEHIEQQQHDGIGSLIGSGNSSQKQMADEVDTEKRSGIFNDNEDNQDNHHHHRVVAMHQGAGAQKGATPFFCGTFPTDGPGSGSDLLIPGTRGSHYKGKEEGGREGEEHVDGTGGE
jgi:hypothetical protein